MLNLRAISSVHEDIHPEYFSSLSNTVLMLVLLLQKCTWYVVRSIRNKRRLYENKVTDCLSVDQYSLIVPQQ